MITSWIPDRRPPAGFRYVYPTPAEAAAYHGPMYRLECRACRKRIWGSGQAVGMHRKYCKGVAS